jgi:hypothetical protein
MRDKKALLTALFILAFVFIINVGIVKAAISNEGLNEENSQLVEVVRLPDGTIERHYANGTVRHDYSVTLQFSPNITFTTTTRQMVLLFWTPTDFPDNDFFPEITITFLFICGIGAAGILRMFKSLRRRPVQPRMPKVPFEVQT